MSLQFGAIANAQDVLCPKHHVVGFLADKGKGQAIVGQNSVTTDQLQAGQEIAVWIRVKPGIECVRDSYRETIAAAADPRTANDARE